MDTIVSTATRQTFIKNIIASRGGQVGVGYGDLTVSGELVKDGQTIRLTLKVESLDVFLGKGIHVNLAGGYSAPWDELSPAEQEAVSDYVEERYGSPDGENADIEERCALRMMNLSFIREHGDLDASDFRRMAAVKALILKAREATHRPLPGDAVSGAYYSGAHPFEGGMLDFPYPWDEDGRLVLCAHPYSPFTEPSGSRAEGYCFSMSGGPFFRIRPEDLVPAGRRTMVFTVWGHAGVCGNGALRFPVEVNAWTLAPSAGI